MSPAGDGNDLKPPGQIACNHRPLRHRDGYVLVVVFFKPLFRRKLIGAEKWPDGVESVGSYSSRIGGRNVNMFSMHGGGIVSRSAANAIPVEALMINVQRFFEQ